MSDGLIGNHVRFIVGLLVLLYCSVYCCSILYCFSVDPNELERYFEVLLDTTTAVQG